jgi:hypothetical protein
MRRRRRAARGPLGGRGGSFILDVILHLELKHVKDKFWVYGSAMGLEWGAECHFGQDQATDTRFCAGIRNEPETLLTNF